MIQLFEVKEQIKVDWPPESSSVALSLAIIRETIDRRSEVALNRVRSGNTLFYVSVNFQY